MKKNQIRKSVAALAMAVVVGVSLLGYGCGSKSASTAGGVSGDFTGTAKGMGGDVTVTLTLEDGKITGCTAEGKDETPGIGTLALEQLPAQIAETGSIAVDGVVHRDHHLQRHQGGSSRCPDCRRPERRRL